MVGEGSSAKLFKFHKRRVLKIFSSDKTIQNFMVPFYGPFFVVQLSQGCRALRGDSLLLTTKC